MKQTYFALIFDIVRFDCDDVVRTSGVLEGNEFETNGEYDGDNFWNGF